MKYTQYFLILAAFLFLAVSCKDDDDPVKNPVDLLPLATQEGAFTFGCLINGEPFIVTNSNKMVALFQHPTQIQIGASNNNTNISMILNDDNMSETIYELGIAGNKRGRAEYSIIEGNKICIYETNELFTGSASINFIDKNNFIVSGTFEFEAVSSDCQDTVRITDGRFDLQYIP